MQRALDSAIGLPRRSTSASWMLAFLMPEEVRRNLNGAPSLAVYVVPPSERLSRGIQIIVPGRRPRNVPQIEAAFSRYRAIGHAPSLVFEITVSVTAARGSCTDRNETPASYPSRSTASFDAWSQKPSP